MSDDRKELAAAFAALSDAAARVCRALGGNPVAAPAVTVSDADLDGPHGRPKIRLNPRDWKGESCKDRSCELCPPEFLDLYAETLDYFAGKNAEKGDAKKAGYDRRDAARIRAWAARLRGGWKPTERTDAPPSNGAGMPSEPMPGDEFSGASDDDFSV